MASRLSKLNMCRKVTWNYVNTRNFGSIFDKSRITFTNERSSSSYRKSKSTIKDENSRRKNSHRQILNGWASCWHLWYHNSTGTVWPCCLLYIWACPRCRFFLRWVDSLEMQMSWIDFQSLVELDWRNWTTAWCTFEKSFRGECHQGMKLEKSLEGHLGEKWRSKRVWNVILGDWLRDEKWRRARHLLERNTDAVIPSKPEEKNQIKRRGRERIALIPSYHDVL